jgi:tetratricopeptide (TPR) repeat protein
MAQKSTSAETPAPESRGLRVVVAETEKPLRRAIAQMLEEVGFQEVHQAATGSEAWAYLRRNGADFIIAGWNMPEMNGMALLKIVRTDPELFSVPVFLVTHHINQTQVIEAGEAGVTDIVLLPLSKGTFQRKLEAVFQALPEPEFQRAERFFQQGLELMKQGRWEEALAAFREVLDAHENAEVYYNMGYIKTAQGRYEEAIQFFRRATQIKNDFARAYQKMGECYLSLNRPRLAEQSFQQAAAIYMEKQMDDYAEQVLKEVLKINPETINVYNNLGIIYRRQGRYQRAIRQYEKALKVSPRDENVHYNLGRTYYEMKEYPQAKEAVAEALDIHPAFKEAKSLLQAIELRLAGK